LTTIEKNTTLICMDPKQHAAQLDPKMKEAYDKVMNTVIAASPTPTTTPPTPGTSPIQGTATQKPTNPPMTPPITPSSVPPPITTTVSVSRPVTQPTITQVTSPVSPTAHREPEKVHIGGAPTGFTTKKQSAGISPVFYVIGAIIFLVVYTIFWLKFFQIPVPFLPF
jgi:hypothetical protein